MVKNIKHQLLNSLEFLLFSLLVISEGSPFLALPSALPIFKMMLFFCSLLCCVTSSSGSPATTLRLFSHSIALSARRWLSSSCCSVQLPCFVMVCDEPWGCEWSDDTLVGSESSILDCAVSAANDWNCP